MASKYWLACETAIRSLSAPAAEALSHFKGTLDLYGLTSLSDAAAEAVSRHEGTLEMTCLATLSDTAAEALSRHKGPLTLSTELSAKVSANRSPHIK